MNQSQRVDVLLMCHSCNFSYQIHKPSAPILVKEIGGTPPPSSTLKKQIYYSSCAYVHLCFEQSRKGEGYIGYSIHLISALFWLGK